MARIKYTVTFPAAPAGAEVTWSQSVEVYADKDTHRRLYEASLDSANTAVVWSEVDPLAVTCNGETLTMTAGSATQTGAAASGGSGASGTPNDWLSVYKFVANQLITNDGTGGAPPGYTLALFSHGDDPPPRGTAFTWDGAGTITANVDLICDVSAKVVVAAHDAGGGYAYGGEILFNDDNTGPGYSYDVFQLPVPDNPGRSAVSTFMIPGLAMTAGQTLRMILQSEVPETVKIQECVMTVSRRG